MVGLEILTRRYGGRRADTVLRATGVIGALGIPLTLLVPEAGALVGFVLVTVWVNGPLAPFMPAAYESVVMLFGRLYPPLGVAALAIVGSLYIELLNYHLYRRILGLRSLAGLSARPWVRKTVELYRRSPFLAVWICSWSPLPYWPVRFLSPLAEYPVGKHLAATFLGRFPRVWFFAALGRWWDISSAWLIGLAVGGTLLGAGVWAVRRLRRGRASASRHARERPAPPDPEGSRSGEAAAP